MDVNQFYLFKDKRFLPIFIAQFCGCLNDSILKNALIILITFKLSSTLTVGSYVLIMLANVLFISPFILFASLAGQIADRYERSVLVKIIKFAEIIIILISTYGFYHTNLPILFCSLTLMGIHSTFFGPIKYSVLPDKLKKEELMSANGYVEAGTFMSILFGTIIGGFYNFNGSLIILIALIVSCLGFAASFFMPASGNANSEIKINPNIIAETVNIVRYAYSKTQVYLAILGISWFWFIGSVILAQIPLLTKETFGADESVATLFLTIFSVGVGTGSFLCNKIIGNNITTKYVFITSIGLSIFCLDLYFASKIAEITYEPENLKNIIDFLSKKIYWRILVDLFFLSAFGGLYVVPLFAVMQYFTSPAYRSRVIAANNLINSFFMAASTGLLSFLFYVGFSVPSIILVISILNFVVAIRIYKLIPNTKIIPLKLWRAIFRLFFDCLYDVKIKGIENYKKAGKRAVVIANHLSYIDPPLMVSYVTDKIQFAIDLTISKALWVKPFLKIIKTFPIDQNNPMAIKSLIDEVKKDRKIAIFPEGRISMTGGLMKIYEGPGMIADKANATILPIRIDGTQFTFFSKIKKLMKCKFALRRKITITVLPPVKITPPSDLDNRQRRRFFGDTLYTIMTDMMFESSNYKQTLFQSLINSAKSFGMKSIILEDIENNELSYRNLILKSFTLGNLISKETKNSENVGLMLPNIAETIITFFAIQSSGAVPAMINFTIGADHIISAIESAKIKTIYTSDKFIQKENLQNIINLIEKNGVKIIYLENLKKGITLLLKIKTFIGSIFPQTYYQRSCKTIDDKQPAVILFTQDQPIPKAIALSHRNVQANLAQSSAIIDFNPNDIAFNALPLFHNFGITNTIIMLFSGIRSFLYQYSNHYRIVPEIIYNAGATIIFGTDSLLESYAAHCHAYDFYSVRYVISGVEKLKDETKKLWLDKFGIRILESYSTPEASNIIAMNTPMHYKSGTVGRLLPKIEYFLEQVNGVEKGGRLYIKGPNIMLGYISSDTILQPSVEKLGSGWYDTGDIAYIDQEGYVTIFEKAHSF